MGQPSTTETLPAVSRPLDVGLTVVVADVVWPIDASADQLLRGLAATGHRLVVLSRSRPADDWLAETGARWVPGPAEPRFRSTARAAARSIRATSAQASAAVRDVALAHRRWSQIADADVLYVPSIDALLSAPELFDLGIPIVASCDHASVSQASWNHPPDDLSSPLAEVFARVDLVICASVALVDDAAGLGLDPAKARVVHPAVDAEVFGPPPSRPSADGFTVLAVGSLIWQKSYEHSVLAVAEARRLGADVRLRIIGDGPDRQHLSFTIDDLGLCDHVELAGQRTTTEVRSELQRADAFLHTSSSEGISNSVLEAMATGLPIVTTDAGGMAEAVRHGVDGFVVAVGATEAAGRALVQIAEDHSLARDMGAAARQRVEATFRLTDQVAAFDRVLREAAATRT